MNIDGTLLHTVTALCHDVHATKGDVPAEKIAAMIGDQAKLWLLVLSWTLALLLTLESFELLLQAHDTLLCKVSMPFL